MSSGSKRSPRREDRGLSFTLEDCAADDAELELARRVKDQVRALTADWPESPAIGITMVQGRLAVKLSFTVEPAPARLKLVLLQIDGVRIVTVTSGRAHPQE